MHKKSIYRICLSVCNIISEIKKMIQIKSGFRSLNRKLFKEVNFSPLSVQYVTHTLGLYEAIIKFHLVFAEMTHFKNRYTKMTEDVYVIKTRKFYLQFFCIAQFVSIRVACRMFINFVNNGIWGCVL
jgi:hypothetical protein